MWEPHAFAADTIDHSGQPAPTTSPLAAATTLDEHGHKSNNDLIRHAHSGSIEASGNELVGPRATQPAFAVVVIPTCVR